LIRAACYVFGEAMSRGFVVRLSLGGASFHPGNSCEPVIQSRSIAERKVGPGPLTEDGEAVAEADEKEDVDDEAMLSMRESRSSGP